MDALYNLGILCNDMGQKHRAIFLYETAVHHNAQLPELHNNLGVLYKQMGSDEMALKCYQNALAINPRFALVPTKAPQSMERGTHGVPHRA